MARGAFRAVDQRPDPVGRFNLGVLMEERGDLVAAEQAYRTADSRGHPAAAVNLGVVLESRGDIQGAEAAYRRAQKRGEPNGAFNLGVLLEERGDSAGAERAYRFADQHGHAAAACNLGAMLAERGDTSAAEAAFRRADERGEPNAGANLAMLLGNAAAADLLSPAVHTSETATPADHDVERAKTPAHRRPERSHAQRGLDHHRRVTPRRAALVLVPAAVAVAAVLAFNSPSMKAPKRTVTSAAIADSVNRPSVTAAGEAPPHVLPALSSVRKAAARAPKRSVAHVARPKQTSHPRHVSSPPAHTVAPAPAPYRSAPTFVASGGGSASTGPSSGTRAVVPTSPAPSNPQPSRPSGGSSGHAPVAGTGGSGTSSGGSGGSSNAPSAPSSGTGPASTAASSSGTGTASGGG